MLLGSEIRVLLTHDIHARRDNYQPMTTQTQQSARVGLGYILQSAESPRDLTRRLSWLVRYPKRINDLGRSTQVDRIEDRHYKFQVRSKRYLGRGAYTVSALATGTIQQTGNQTAITVQVELGKLYHTLLSIMTASVALSYLLVFVTILFLPLALLMSMVIWMHWSYLYYDRYRLAQDIAAILLGKEKHNYDEA